MAAGVMVAASGLLQGFRVWSIESANAKAPKPSLVLACTMTPMIAVESK